VRKDNNFCVKAVIFDMDGVITNTMPYHFNAWKEALAKRGIWVSCYDVYKREGQPGKETVKEIFSEHSRFLDRDEQKDILREKEGIFNAKVRTKFVKGSRPFLKNLKNRGFRIAIVTGTSRKEVRKILPKEIYNLFDTVVTSDEVKNGKPNPEPFLRGIKNLGVSKKEAIVIENAPFGVLAAKKAGLCCIAVETSLPKRFLKGADLVFKSIADLQKNVSFNLVEG